MADIQIPDNSFKSYQIKDNNVSESKQKREPQAGDCIFNDIEYDDVHRILIQKRSNYSDSEISSNSSNSTNDNDITKNYNKKEQKLNNFKNTMFGLMFGQLMTGIALFGYINKHR